MNLTRSLLKRLAAACGLFLLASCGGSNDAGPDAAMNAARVPNADMAVAVNVAKIQSAPFAKQAEALVEKAKKIAPIHDLEKFETVDQLTALLKEEKISIKTFTVSMNIADAVEAMHDGGPDMPDITFAARLDNPLKEESFKKLLTKLAGIAGEDDAFEFQGKDAFDDDGKTVISLTGNDRVVLAGRVDAVNSAKDRAKAGKRAEEHPAMKSLLDARRDFQLVVIPPEKNREDLFDQLPGGLIPENARNALQKILGAAVAMDVTDKTTVEIKAVFNDPAAAKDFGDFVSIMLVGLIKSGLYAMTGSNLPFMDSLKAATTDKVVTLSFEITIPDLEQLMALVQKQE